MSDAKIQARNHESYGLYSLIGFLLPLVGFILGAIMLSKEGKLDKKLGEHTIVMSVVGAIVVAAAYALFIGWATTKTTNELNTYNPNPITAPSNQQSNADMAAFYNGITNGMTKDQVVVLAKKQPTNCATSEAQGLGMYESCYWTNNASVVTVNFKDNITEGKGKSGF